jgi:putative hydrolase of the HAD superfamily
MITTFLFDLGGVLFTNGTKKFIKEISKSYMLSENIITEVIDGEIGSLYREAKISRDEFWRQVIEKLHLNESVDILEKQWIDSYEIISGTKQIIIELSKKYSLYYLSDNVKERVDALDTKFDFLKLFKGGIFSHEVGVRKPDPKIYEFALNKSNSNPERTIFIDDKEMMLKPARTLGLHTILFSTPQELKNKLTNKGLL